MDFKLNSQAFSCSVSALDCAVEQPVEMDYILPDYFPDIFRVLKCDVIPKISSHTISSGKLAMDICVTIRVLYVGNDWNDEVVANTGCETLCLNADETDCTNTAIWHNHIETDNLLDILPFIKLEKNLKI